MFKRIIIPIVLVISVFLTSCSYTIKFSEREVKGKNTNKSNSVKVNKNERDPDIVYSPYYTPVNLTNGYDLLNEDEQAVYDEILANTLGFTDEREKDSDRNNYVMETFTVYDCYITKRQLAKVFTAVSLDNPQLFWIDEPYAYLFNDGELELRIYATMTKKEYTNSKQQLNAVINTLLAGLEDGMSDYELELYFHDYLVRNCIYNKEADAAVQKNPYTAYGCLVEQNAVCSGYTAAMQLLLSYVGINSVTVSGTDDETAHIWNAIVLDDDWYYTDVTWDDTDELHMYDYFNVTSEELFKTHEASPLITEFDDTQLFSSDGTITTFNLFIPDCNAEKYNYYRYSGSVYGGAENNTLEEDLKRVADKKEPYFHIVIDTDKLSFEDAYEELFSEDSYTFADYIDRANASISENKLSTSVSIYKKKDLNTITIQLKYS